ncbi:MAG: NYN domain-containing protein [Specibacter sp.]
MAIFLDVENLFGGYHRDVTGVQLGKVVRGIEQILCASGIGEKTALVRAYANWARADMAVYRREVLEHGIKPVQIFSFEKNVKNAADIELCVEVLEVAQDSPWVDVFVIVTGDGGFVPLIRRLHSLNKYVVVVSTTAPNSGIVNPLLKSVADEYHQIDVQGAPWALGVVPPDPVAVQPPVPSVDAVPAVATVAAVPGKVVGMPPAPAVAKKLPAGSPELAVLRKFILGVVRTQPQLSKKGKVDAAALGQLLRKKWPDLKYTTYQSTNLSSFVEKHCGLVAQRPVPKKAKPAVNLPVQAPVPAPKQAAARTVTNREEYIASVRAQFTEGELGRMVRDSNSEGMNLGNVSVQLRAAITGFTSADAGFPKLHAVLQHALVGTDFRIARMDDTTLAAVHTRHVDPRLALPPITTEGLKDPDLVRRVLGKREPVVRYPEKFILSDIIRVAFESAKSHERPDYVASVYGELPHLPVETVHHTVGLLLTVGALIEDESTGCLTVNPRAGTETQALDMVIDDALRRAAEVRWPVNAGELLLALY